MKLFSTEKLKSQPGPRRCKEDRLRQRVEVLRLYLEEKWYQVRIANHLGLSQSQVSRDIKSGFLSTTIQRPASLLQSSS